MSSYIDNNKRIAKNAAVLYLRMFFTMAIGLYTSRLILSSLGSTDFGLYNVVGGIVPLFSPIVATMSAASSRFLTITLGKGDKEELKRIFSISVTVQLLCALIIIIFGETIGLWWFYNKMVIPDERFIAALWCYQLSILTSALGLMLVPYNASIISHERMSAFAYLSIIDVILKLLICYVVIYIPYDKLITYSTLLFLISLLYQFINVIYCKRNFEEAKYHFLWDKKIFKEMLSFSTWKMFGSYGYAFSSQGVNLIINMFCGPAVNAARAVSMQVQSIVTRFTNNIFTAINPQITKSYAAGNYSYMHTLIFASSRYSYFLFFTLSLPIIIHARPLLTLWLGDVPQYSVEFTQLILISTMIDVSSNPLISSIDATGKLKVYMLTLGSILFLKCILSYLLLRIGMGIISVFILDCIISFVLIMSRVLITVPLINMSIREYIKEVIVRIIIVSIIMLIIAYLFTICESTSISYIIFSSLVLIMSSLIVIFILGLNKIEKDLIRSKVIKYIK